MKKGNGSRASAHGTDKQGSATAWRSDVSERSLNEA